MNHRNEATISALELELIGVLQSCAEVLELSPPVSLMLTMELAVQGKPMEAITLGELRAALERVANYFNS